MSKEENIFKDKTIETNESFKKRMAKSRRKDIEYQRKLKSIHQDTYVHPESNKIKKRRFYEPTEI